jgi:hypothetical protein
MPADNIATVKSGYQLASLEKGWRCVVSCWLRVVILENNKHNACTERELYSCAQAARTHTGACL